MPTLSGGFTYSLGHSLYVPLTSRCNSLTLPQTRGPGFLLPAQVVASLRRVRDAEEGTERWTQFANWLDAEEERQSLPEPMERVDRSWLSPGRPTVTELLSEIPENSSSIVIAGEGEPTLRMAALEELVTKLRRQQPSDCHIRVTSNGLFPVAHQLALCGVDSVSVALMTHDPEQYNDLMQPTCDHGYERVLEFVTQAQKEGLKVELTAVDQPGVDQDKTNKMAKSLVGIENPVRWRPFFPG